MWLSAELCEREKGGAKVGLPTLECRAEVFTLERTSTEHQAGPDSLVVADPTQTAGGTRGTTGLWGEAGE